MRSTSPVPIDKTLLAAVEQAAALAGRSAAAQLAHWARLGQAVEVGQSPDSAIGAVLADWAGFDDLSEEDQAVVSAVWEERIGERLRTLDMTTHHAADGTPYAELNDDGEVVVRRPTADRG
jgi:hypothetical protein